MILLCTSKIEMVRSNGDARRLGWGEGREGKGGRKGRKGRKRLGSNVLEYATLVAMVTR